MRITGLVSIVTIAVLAGGVDARAQAPAAAAAPTNTLWRFLGIPQGINKIKDATRNKNGNHPERERKPPLKRIGDPANLESKNPAIKAAAKIKTEEDLAPQKIKAIKYLATIGCGCYPDVREALVAALGDCTEAVRYQAAIALCQVAGNHCKVCDQTCCNAAVMSKLEEMAHGQDEQGCYKEASPRVRAAAENALNACRRKLPGAEQKKEVPEKKETPTPAAPEPPSSPETPRPLTPTPARNVTPTSWSNANQSRDGVVPEPRRGVWANVTPVSNVGFAEVDDGEPQKAEVKDPQKIADAVAMVRCPTQRRPFGFLRGRETVVCPEEGTPPAGESKAAPGEADAAAPPEQPTAPSDALAGSYGATSGPMSAAPNMMGDFCSSGGRVILRGFNRQEQFGVLSSGNVAIAGGDRAFKIAENDNPIPTNRVFFDYNHFQNPVVDALGNERNLDRFTFGVEKTFFDGWCSVELRIPVDGGLNSSQSLVPDASLAGTEFGNIPLVFKTLVRKWDNSVLAAGLAVSLPTAEDGRLFDRFGVEQIRVQNDAVHVGPVVGWLWTPSDRWFVEGFAQVDFDTRGNDVYVETGNGLTKAGTVQDQSLMFLDLAVGRWIYKNPSAPVITGIVPTVELHYTSTLQNADIVNGPDFSSFGPTQTVGCPENRRDYLNLTAGVHVLFGAKSVLTVAAVAPLKTGSDREFDAEILAQFNRRF